jgi:hypothetical protein
MMKTLYTIFLFLSFSAYAQPSVNEGITVEIQNNCGKKIELQVELLHNPMNLTLETGLKSRFRLKIGSHIIVNKVKIYQIAQIDEGKAIKLCK